LSAGLDGLNSMPADEAETLLLECCSSIAWAQGMARKRPFRNFSALVEAADRIWWSLPGQDWLEAFSRHPKIDERAAEKPSGLRSAKWSEQEQSGAQGAGAEAKRELAKANRAYADKFGYIFIVCATGKTTEEMLALLKERLQNDPVAELRVAAEEQRKITRLRLAKLVDTEAKP